MAAKKPTTKVVPKKSTSATLKKGLSNKKSFFSWKYAALFIALAIAVGGYVIYKSYAADSALTWPRNAYFTPGARTSNRLIQAAICQSGQNRIWIAFSKNDTDRYTDLAPELVFARNGVRTGSIKGYRTWTRYGDDPSTDQRLGNQAMGNRKADDTVKVKYGTAQGTAVRWSKIPQCKW